MRSYIQTLQSQIARNSAEITLRENVIRFSYEELKLDGRKDYWCKWINADKKYLKSLVANQKSLKKMMAYLLYERMKNK